LKKVLIPVVFLGVFLGVALLVFHGQWRQRTSGLYYSGTIEATESNLAEGMAALRQAKDDLRKIEITRRGVKVAEARLGAAQAALHVAEIYLEYTRLRAPFRGIVTSRNIEPGEVVTPGREVISIADLSVVELNRSS